MTWKFSFRNSVERQCYNLKGTSYAVQETWLFRADSWGTSSGWIFVTVTWGVCLESCIWIVEEGKEMLLWVGHCKLNSTHPSWQPPPPITIEKSNPGWGRRGLHFGRFTALSQVLVVLWCVPRETCTVTVTQKEGCPGKPFLSHKVLKGRSS